jgi:hypothetical protein
MTLSDALKRARAACGHGAKYKLGWGGHNPKWLWPWSPADRLKQSDCSGFVSWVYGIPRDMNGRFSRRWIETSRIVADALGANELFRRVAQPRPGDLIVYGDAGGKQGHVGIVSRLDAQGRPDRVIHCNASTADAIAETPVASWWRERGAITARPVFLEEES